MDKALDGFVRQRAGFRCEYCRAPQVVSALTFPIDHIIARQHGGAENPENLALCCGRCNRHKGPNIAGLDPKTGILTRLFHPRRDSWTSHFQWEGLLIVGQTDVGRTTVSVLNLNAPTLFALRQTLWNAGLLPG